jgi:site-specific recombinase XerD
MPNGIFLNEAKGGVYYGSYTDKDGKRRQFSCGTKNRREAERVYREKLKLVWEQQNQARIKRIDLDDFIPQYLAIRKGEGISKAQLKELDSSLRHFKSFIGNPSLSDIHAEQCEQFIRIGPYASGWKSLWTARRHYQNMSAIFAAAVRWGYVKENPFLKFKKPRPIEVLPEYVTHGELERLTSQISVEGYHDRRLKRAVPLAFFTGLRLSEIRYLEISDVNFETCELHVRIKSNFIPKGRKDRVVPMPEQVKTCIMEQLRDNAAQGSNIRTSKYIFPNSAGLPLSLQAFEHPFKDLTKRLFADRKRLRFHSLRHSYGTFLSEKGVSLQLIQKIMGHSSVKTTEIYARLRSNDFSTARAALASVSGPGHSGHTSLKPEVYSDA